MKPFILIVGANSFLASHILKINKEYKVDGVFNQHKSTTEKYNSLFSVNELEQIPYHYDKVFVLASFIPYGKMNGANSNFILSNIDLVSRVSKKILLLN